MRETTSQSSLDSGKNPQSNHDSQQDQGLASSAADDGMPIEDYAEKFLLSETEIWRRIRHGELLGRTHQGRLLIYPASSIEATLADLPPLPDRAPIPTRVGATHERSGADFLGLSGERSSTPELALLLDHLSLAKEENREILRLTDQSMKRVCEMSDALIQMKDAVIVSKDTELLAVRQQRDTEVASLEAKLAASEMEIRRLRQQSEDLEMLARTMAQQATHHE
jgi:hypothetical protein